MHSVKRALAMGDSLYQAVIELLWLISRDNAMGVGGYAAIKIEMRAITSKRYTRGNYEVDTELISRF
jgi:hypothetical protein